MFNGKMKALTLSFDDGVTQDARFIEMLDKYGLKCTFNINSEKLGLPGSLVRNDVRVRHDKFTPDEAKEVYRYHEVAAHTLTHPLLPTLPDSEVIRQVEEDRLNLEQIFGREVVGMAYPGGGVNHDDRVVKLVRENTNIRYARGIDVTSSFDLPSDLLRTQPSAYIVRFDEMWELGRKFLELTPEKEQVFNIFGHAYEFDAYDLWGRMDEFLSMMSEKEDIFYGTYKEIFLKD